MRLKMNHVVAAGLIAMICVVQIGCGSKTLKKESVLDTPDNHYNQGMRELDRGNIAAAKGEFERARGLDPNYPEAYGGLGLALANEGQFDKALDMVNDGLGKNDKSVECRIIKGRVLAMRMKGDDWLNDAVNEFDKAIKTNPNSDKAYFYKGEAYKVAYQFDMAASAYSKAIGMKGDYAERANDQWALVQKIQRAAPGTKIGAKIALIPEINRADLSVLLMEEMKLAEVFAKKRQPTFDTGYKAPDDPTKMQTAETQKMAAYTDVPENFWAKNWIADIVKIGGMDVFPDHTFRPNEKITRANYAMVMQNILIAATGQPALATKYIGGDSRFPDVRSDHFAYNSMALMVDRGIMTADKMSGAFNPEGNMSGADALLAIRDFQNALRLEFK
jgi:tetratricopeptide (TPR) repeat protein